ncbi:Diacylglycerol O-acyltransferase [Candidatus Magnetomorum sp. HK-1]|nr:Diacylglycerol O-acyltransferase [Candidatus Magnetomorum sp. HK-1]
MSNKTINNIDNFWLNLDGNTNLMIITTVFEFDKPLDYDRLCETIEKRWLIYDRFKMRLTEPVLGLPKWETDLNFDIRSHVQRVALPGKGDKVALQDMISDLTSIPLDRTRPLWQVHLIENYNGGCVLFWRIHHCIADGISLSHVLLSTADKSADAPLPKTKISIKSDTPNNVKNENILGKTFELLTRPLNLKKWKKTASDVANIGNLLTKQMVSDSQTVFKGKIGVRKCIAWSDPMSLAEAKSIGKLLGGTLNDVVVTAVTGALRRYLLEKNTTMDDVNIRVSMPVNIRERGTESDLGNQFGLVNLDLPVSIEDPILRFNEVKKRNDKIKNSSEATTSFQALKTMGMAPGKISKKAADFFADKGTAVFSNVPGPKNPIYFAGQEMKNIMFWVPRTGHMGMGISIISYNGKITMGLASDEKRVSDPQTILEYFKEEMKDFRQLVEFEETLKKQIQASQGIESALPLQNISKKPACAVKSNGFKNRLKKISSLGVKSKSFDELVQKYTGKDSKFIDINGIKVHYCDQGEGPTIVLLHGMLASLQTWDDWVESLGAHYRIIRLDIPGFGLTDHFENFTKDVCVDFLNQFFEALDLEKVDIAGNSIGGYIAWNYALKYPEKVNKLVLIDSVGYPQDLPRIVNFVNIPGMKKLASRITPRIFIEKNIKEIYGDKSKVTDELIDLYHDMLINQQNRGVFIDFFRLLKKESSSILLSEGINEIKAPTLLMWGKNDPWVPVTVVKDWERDLASSKTILYDGVGHLPMEEIPQQSAYDAHAFLMS